MSKLVKAIWTNSISRAFGKLASYRFPTFIQLGINWIYIKVTGVDLSNFYPLSHYDSLNALFTRELVFDRQMPNDPAAIVSPVDSLISELGNVEDGKALQIKGFSYLVSELLTENLQYNRVLDGVFVNLYLSPKDYHRYHAPMDMKVTKIVHVPGFLYPVNFKYLNKIDSLFVKNERVILECYDNSNRLFYMVLVGALNVGGMTISFEPSIETNRKASQLNLYEYADMRIKKGEELGMFKMGSTVVLIFEKDFIEIESEVGKKIRFGDIIAVKR